jgi:hypothetical protein
MTAEPPPIVDSQPRRVSISAGFGRWLGSLHRSLPIVFGTFCRRYDTAKGVSVERVCRAASPRHPARRVGDGTPVSGLEPPRL